MVFSKLHFDEHLFACLIVKKDILPISLLDVQRNIFDIYIFRTSGSRFSWNKMCIATTTVSLTGFVGNYLNILTIACDR